MKEALNKLYNILDSVISNLEPNFEYPQEVVGKEGYAASCPGNTALITNSNENIFQEIYDHESVKTVLNMALRSEKPVHILLTSPPGMAKTQFLLAIRNMFNNQSCFVIGSNSTKKGIIDALFEKRPQR